MEYKAIVLAAGQGKRMKMGYNKQLIRISHVPLIIHSLRLFEEDVFCKSILLVVSPDEYKEINHLLDHYHIQKVERLVIGGKERQDSVFEALNVIEDTEVVLIHDGARPFVKQETIAKVAKAAFQTGGAIAAVPVKDTIKKTRNGAIQETVKRDDLWAAQTPQGFRLDLIKHAHLWAKKDGYVCTDDASLLEMQGKSVAIVESDYLNIKITTIEDLLFAETILKTKEKKRS